MELCKKGKLFLTLNFILDILKGTTVMVGEGRSAGALKVEFAAICMVKRSTLRLEVIIISLSEIIIGKVHSEKKMAMVLLVQDNTLFLILLLKAFERRNDLSNVISCRDTN